MLYSIYSKIQYSTVLDCIVQYLQFSGEVIKKQNNILPFFLLLACILEGALQGRERQAYWEEEYEEAAETTGEAAEEDAGEAAGGAGEAAGGAGEAAVGVEVEGTGSLEGAGLSTFLKY